VTRTFSYTQALVSEGGQEFENFSKKDCFLSSSDKTKISPLWPPLEKLLEKSTCGPLEKILPTPMHTSMLNYTTFVKNYAVLHHLTALFNNTNAVSKP